jgi:hypothetical protein
MPAASGSAPLRQWQPDFGVAGWCIGHCPEPGWTQVHVIASAAAGWAKIDAGAAVRIDSWQHSHAHAICERRRRKTITEEM